jgi:GTP cyclohydrolase IA
MTVRGVHKPGAAFVTSALRGACKDRSATRAEVLALINGNRT